MRPEHQAHKVLITNKNIIIVHHSESDSSTYEKIKRFHTAPEKYDANGSPLGKGWRHIGYHIVIEDDGRIRRGLEDYEVGIHTVNWNHCSLAVCICGNLDRHPIVLTQWKSLIKVVAQWCLQHNIVPSGLTVVGHKDKQATKKNKDGSARPNRCPGTYLYSRLPELRTAVAQQLAVAGDLV